MRQIKVRSLKETGDLRLIWEKICQDIKELCRFVSGLQASRLLNVALSCCCKINFTLRENLNNRFYMLHNRSDLRRIKVQPDRCICWSILAYHTYNAVGVYVAGYAQIYIFFGRDVWSHLDFPCNVHSVYALVSFLTIRFMVKL